LTHVEVCKEVAKKCKLSEEEVRAVVESFVNITNQALIEGDEVKIKGLGTLYSKAYHVAKRDLEFGQSSEGGERRRIRFRPFESANTRITDGWKALQPVPKKRSV